MPHRSIIRVPQNKNISKAGNGCLVLIIYFIILLIFRKYWIMINLTVCGLLLTSVVVFYCLKASHDLDSDESSTNSDDGSSSDSDEEGVCRSISNAIRPATAPEPRNDKCRCRYRIDGPGGQPCDCKRFVLPRSRDPNICANCGHHVRYHKEEPAKRQKLKFGDQDAVPDAFVAIDKKHHLYHSAKHWRTFRAMAGARYYYNMQTGETTQHKPKEVKAMPARVRSHILNRTEQEHVAAAAQWLEENNHSRTRREALYKQASDARVSTAPKRAAGNARGAVECFEI